MSEAVTTYIGLGSNLGDRETSIREAIKKLGENDGIEVSSVSDIIETSPLSGTDQPAYLNAAAKIKTTLTPEKLFGVMATIEDSLGRQRGEKWASRTIDLDLLLFDDKIIKTPDLTVPHSQMHLRSFVLAGLCQLNSKLQHPVLKETVDVLAGRLGGGDFVLNADSVQLISIAGIIGVGKTTLAKRLAKELDCRWIAEPYDENPYLPKVYAGDEGLALDSQLYFLTHRQKQLDADTLTVGRMVISDYVFDKELIYARRLLSAEQLRSYEDAYPSIANKVVRPVLVIHLTDSAENCLSRIHKRNRPYEQKITLQLLQGFDADYEKVFEGWDACPVISLSASQFDCKRDSDIEYLVNQIRSYVVQ